MARVAVSVSAVAFALALAFVVPRSGELVTSYAHASEALSALGLAAGLSLLAAGVIAVWERRPAGAVAIAAGVTWFAPDLVGWEDGPPLARSVGLLLAPLLPVVLLHLVHRRRIAVVYLVVATLSLALSLVRDPFADEHCWSNCSENVFLAAADERLAQLLGTLLLAAALILGVAVVAVAGWRRTPWPVLAPAAAAGVGEAAYALALLATPDEDPSQPGFAALFAFRAAAYALLGAGLSWVATRERRTRAAVAQVTSAVPLRDVLARALGDPGVQVAYPVPFSGRTVDARGAPLTLDTGRVLTRIERGGQPVAIVAHDASLDGAALEREIGAAARLAVDNERLQAIALAQLGDLRASLARIVETGDEARRRLERDLHDGAQQRLLALTLELRLGGAGEELVAEAQAALDELRDLAHGIHPAILTESGLEAALLALADTAPLPVELGAIAPERLPAAVETAAYLLVAGAVEDAARRGAGHVAVDVERVGERLHVRVAGQRRWQQPLVDRVGALGGRVGPEEAELPCA